MDSKIPHQKISYNIKPVELKSSNRKLFADKLEQHAKKHILARHLDDYVFATARAVDVGDYFGVLNPNKKAWEHCVNANGDYFDYTEMVDTHPRKNIPRYKTFADRGFYRDHKSDKIENAIGFVFDSVLNTLDSGETIISCLIGVDKMKAPDVARTLTTYPEKQGVSMGCTITHSICTNCGHNTEDMTKCECLTRYHNRRHPRTKVLVAEMVKGVDFFELSGVTNPAFAFSYVLDVVKDWIPGKILRVANSNPNNKDLLSLVHLFGYINKKLSTASFEDKLYLNAKLDSIINELETYGVV
jgi:hypothetical protein